MSSKNIIIDSSVTIKWYLPDESDNQALKLKEDFFSGTILISIPLLFFYEMNNILKTTTKALRINSQKAIKAYQDLLELNFLVYSSKDLLKKALEKALALDISSYDASYIVLSEYLQLPFYTADQRLIKKVNDQMVRQLQNYPE